MRRTLLIASLLMLGGCYHATVNTGLAPSPVRIEREWAGGWIFGIVPPSAMDAVGRCPDGVARVETQLSFANQLVSYLTFGIYTPMSIEVTCAAPGDQ